MDFPAACFLRHIRACTNAVLPGERQRLVLGGAPVGYVRTPDAPPAPLQDAGAFAHHVERLRQAKRFRIRREAFDVRDERDGTVLATVDRGAVPLLGIPAQGVHCNGLVRRADGIHLWVGRRAPDKRLEPDKLDHLTAGGVPAGHGVWETLVKEGAEEASLPGTLAVQAEPAGVLRYAMEHGEGLRRDCLHVFDLWLPEHFTPVPQDGEVVEFMRWPIETVLRRVAETDDVKFNVSLVLTDLFLRLGLIDPATTQGGAVAREMAPLREPATCGPPPARG